MHIMIIKAATLILLAAFYLSYIAKMILLNRQNIKGNILGKGQKETRKVTLEIALKSITYLGAAVQFFSVIWDEAIWSLPVFPTMREDGLILMAFGVITFVMAIVVMRDNWRAGYSEDQNTVLVTKGIYKYSRNPAFLGFDFLYIGCALAFPNVLNIAFMIAAVTLLHLQILGEEAFLAKAFGADYNAYKVVAMRYLGHRKGGAL